MSSSSTPSTPTNNLSDVFSAMNEETPVAPSLTTAQKRNHAAMAGAGNSDDENDNDNDNDGIPSFSLPNQNTVNAIQRYAERKRLRGEQTTEATIFVNDTPAVRDTKLLINLLHLSNVLGKIVTSAPPYEVSAALEKNLHDYATAILLSSKISAYKGSVPTNTLLDILKKHRFDLPVGIENNPADFAKVISAVQEAFTQLRSKFKKALLASLKVHKRATELAPGRQQQNIFKVTQVLVEGTQCSVSVELCARVALMRRTYLKDSGVKFWNTLDFDLAEIRAEAKGNAKMVAKAFRHILAQDQTKHGVKDYEITETGVNEFQQTVNDLIDAGAADVASSVQGDAEE
ncbi:hypothetical protein B0H10DRAFT_2194958 [Mycena sp. CBHHK59/15]|nr:hypothetical protein B0H10DRAFT_2240620 [Mycena sp. CBHHK59/15]KAJ6607324.1 hypothetical protein B0H10DRAFT_2194958 [Mycena sp. CBHHK59/15]